MYARGEPFNEKFFEKSLVGYRLVIVTSLIDLPAALEHWKLLVEEKAELEVILTDEILGDGLADSDSPREYEAITVEGSKIKGWDIAEIMRVGDGFDFHGFGLPPTSEIRATKILVSGKVT